MELSGLGDEVAILLPLGDRGLGLALGDAVVIGDEIDRETALAAGVREDRPGCALAPGIVDIWPPGSRTPIRLDFFGDVLDGARRFDPETQRTVEKLKRVEFSAVSEIILDEAAIARFRQNYRIAFGALILVSAALGWVDWTA
mgnify:CR=1 FL=1